ncbi:MAG: Ig-like domain-containing protein [Treponema sp.]|jgi:hypothetical protein|nr:Ig-like domain-containing protein [Treponema sp.]
MKNFPKILPAAIIAFIAVLAFSFIGCDELGPSNDPTLTGTVTISGFIRVGDSVTANIDLDVEGVFVCIWQSRANPGAPFAPIQSAVQAGITYAPVDVPAGHDIRVMVSMEGYSGAVYSNIVKVREHDAVEPVIDNVTVSGDETINPGQTKNYTATVTGTDLGADDKNVTWSVTGGITGTNIDANGNLTVASGQTPSSILTVRATSTIDSTKYGLLSVTVVSTTPPGDNGKTITITGLGDFNNGEIWVFLVDDDDLTELMESGEEPEIVGEGLIKDGTATISLWKYDAVTDDMEPWTGGGNWYVGIWIESDVGMVVRISTDMVNFDGAAASRPFNQFRSMMFEYTFGRLVKELFGVEDFNWASVSTLDQLVIALGEGYYLGYDDWSTLMGVEYFTDYALTIPFTGTSLVDAATSFFTDIPFGFSDNVSGGPDMGGELIGTLGVNITLTDISSYPSVVSINISGWGDKIEDDEYIHSSWGGSTRLNTIGAANNASFSVGIPIYSYHDNVFIADNVNFSLSIRPSGIRDSFNKPIETSINITGPNQQSINLGPASVQGVRLSGTINFNYTGSESVNYVYITARSVNNNWYGSSNVDWPNRNTWTMLVPVTTNARKVTLSVQGAYTDDDGWHPLFYQTASNNVQVSNQPIAGININLGNVAKDNPY